LWYFKLLIFMTDTLVALLGLEVFSRKSKRLWARVGVAFICEVWFCKVLETHMANFAHLDGKRIIVEGLWRYRLNPDFSPGLADFLRSIPLSSWPGFSTLRIFFAYGRPHQMFLPGPNANHGFIFTTSRYVWVKDSPFPTTALGNLYPQQHYFYSAVGWNTLDSSRFFLSSVTQNLGPMNRNNFVGLCLRLNLLYLIRQEINLIFQDRERSSVILLKHWAWLSEVYPANYRFRGSGVCGTPE
jgi:hypothetical protein